MPTTHSAPEFFLLQASKNVDHPAIAAAPLRHTVDVTVVLVGPTAVGKSSLAAALGRRYAADGQPAEIVNADSMLVYRGMDIGTAKPSEVERADIRHHIIDVLEVNQATTVAEFQQLARAAIADCRGSRRHPDRGWRIGPLCSGDCRRFPSFREPIRRSERGWRASCRARAQRSCTSG